MRKDKYLVDKDRVIGRFLPQQEVLRRVLDEARAGWPVRSHPEAGDFRGFPGLGFANERGPESEQG